MTGSYREVSTSTMERRDATPQVVLTDVAIARARIRHRLDELGLKHISTDEVMRQLDELGPAEPDQELVQNIPSPSAVQSAPRPTTAPKKAKVKVKAKTKKHKTRKRKAKAKIDPLLDPTIRDLIDPLLLSVDTKTGNLKDPKRVRGALRAWDTRRQRAGLPPKERVAVPVKEQATRSKRGKDSFATKLKILMDAHPRMSEEQAKKKIMAPARRKRQANIRKQRLLEEKRQAQQEQGEQQAA